MPFACHLRRSRFSVRRSGYLEKVLELCQLSPSGCMDARKGTQLSLCPCPRENVLRPPVVLLGTFACAAPSFSAGVSPRSLTVASEELALNHKLRRHQDEASKPVRRFLPIHDEQYSACYTRWHRRDLHCMTWPGKNTRTGAKWRFWSVFGL